MPLLTTKHVILERVGDAVEVLINVPRGGRSKKVDTYRLVVGWDENPDGYGPFYVYRDGEGLKVQGERLFTSDDA